MFGESKFSVLEKIPASIKPRAILIRHPTNAELVIQKIKDNHLSLPLISKPDLGERGWMVKKIKTEEEIYDYIKISKWDFIIQEFVDLPLEFSVYYARHPKRETGNITSVTMKEMLKVTGDGHSKLSELILKKDRAKLQWAVLKNTFAAQLDRIPAKGEVIELVSVGNHCLGTMFINKKEIITKKMVESFDRISCQIEGFYFGRYDLRVQSISDLEQGKVMIMELNGCGAEPSHIYHPGASLIDAVKDLFVHWHTIYQISKANHEKGVPYLRFKEGVRIYKKFKAVTSS